MNLWSKIFTSNYVAENEKGIFDAILRGEIDFVSEPWPLISESAKDLVRKMLTKDPKKRITSTQVLGIESPLFLICNQNLNLRKSFTHCIVISSDILLLLGNSL